MVIAKSKKVNKQMTNTIKNNMDYNWTAGPESLSNQDVGVPRAIFIPHANSLPFEERRVTLEQPVKIGRNVYRATASSTNTIFECRVLSRHHATLYYDKGHFYLVDNQSSNGTFINNNRCSISKEQEPHEVFSGDIVQFGIPVAENAVSNTFPPVVAILKLFHPDGKEAKLAFNPTMTTPLHLREMYQLNNFVQEAIQREASLESRLRTLRECVERTRGEAQASWELFVGEQRLLMRVHTLETMLAVGKQPDTHHVADLLNDKRNYQEVAQESLRAAHEQRLALEESLERRSREAAALHQHNCTLRLAANNAFAELQKLAARCERKMCAARLAIAAAEEREQAVRSQLPLAYSVQNGEAKMLILSTDSNKLEETKRTGSLEDAVRSLPDYIKLLLPQHLLNKVGIKAISAEGKSAKEFELILKKNNIYDSESKGKLQSDGDTVGVSAEDKSDKLDPCTDDEKQSRLNHDQGHDVESSSPREDEIRADNNANSTYTDQDNLEDVSSMSGVEYANILRVMAGLNEEIKTLRERLSCSLAELEKLRGVRDELLAERATEDGEINPPTSASAPSNSTPAPASAPVLVDDATYRARIAELQDQLTRSNASEEANLAEIQRLASNAADMQSELAFRPTRSDIDNLASVIEQLRVEIASKDKKIQSLQKSSKDDKLNSIDRATEISRSFEELSKLDLEQKDIDTNKISAEIDEMFRLDYEDEEETDSVATEIERDDVTIVKHPADTSGEYLKLNDEERLQVTLQNGTLHALEEELVRTKESWAEVCAERARLVTQLNELQSKSTIRVQMMRIVSIAVPIIAACLYYFLYQYLS